MATQKPTASTKFSTSTKATTFMLGKWEVNLRTLLIVVLLVLACVGYALWFFEHFQKVSHTRYQMTERANYNPYYASQLLINEASIASAKQAEWIDSDAEVANNSEINVLENSDAETSDTKTNDADIAPDALFAPVATTLLDDDVKALLDDLPEATTEIDSKTVPNTLIINSMNTSLTPKRFDALQTWVESGGHLITFIGEPLTQNDVEEVNLNALHDDGFAYQLDGLDEEELRQSLSKLKEGNQFLNRLGILNLNYDGWYKKPTLIEEALWNKVSGLREQIESREKAYDTLVKDGDISEAKKESLLKEINQLYEELSPYSDLSDMVEEQEFSLVAFASHPTPLLIANNQYRLNLDTQAFATLFPEATSVDALQVNGQQESYTPIVAYDTQRFGMREEMSDDNGNDDAEDTKQPSLDDIASLEPTDPKNIARLKRIRHYLASEKRHLTEQIERYTAKNKHRDGVNLSSTKHPVANPNVGSLEKLGEYRYGGDKNYLDTLNQSLDYIGFLQQQPSQILLEAFAPAKEAMIDVKLGSGRLTVLTNDTLFVNPNPNQAIYDEPTPVASTVNELADANNLDTSAQPQKSNLASDLLPQPETPLLTNTNHNSLDKFDNAEILLALTADTWQPQIDADGHIITGSVWILPYTDVLPLPNLLWQKARFAVLSLALLIFLWLWSLYNRFGKRQYLTDGNSFDILRYFRQVGRYGWQHDKAHALINNTRKQTLRKLRLHVPVNAGYDTIHDDDVNANTSSNPLNTTLNTSPSDARLTIASVYPFLKDALNKALARGEFKEWTNEAEGQGTNDFSQLLSQQRLNIALFNPLDDKMSAKELTQLSQTLWLINQLLK